MSRSPVSLALIAVALAGCAPQAPFVQPELLTNVQKEKDRVLRDGRTAICFGADTPWDQVVREAEYACGNYGYRAHFSYQERWQCSVGTPHLAMFVCYHPDMRTPSGSYILPSESGAIADWQARTHKQLPKRRAFATPGTDPVQDVLPYLPGAPGAAAGSTPPAPPTPAPPGGDSRFGAAVPVPQWPMGDDAAPSPQAPLPPASPPAAVPAPQPEFTLPAGGWGQAFEQ